MTANGDPVDLSGPARLAPGNERLQIRYTGIHLSAPERVQYFYRLDGLDTDWVAAGGAARDQLQQPAPRALSIQRARGTARRAWQRAVLRVRNAPAVLGDGVVPRACAWRRCWPAAWAIYQLRLRQIRSRFALVLEERARLAREIHDTLAQGFVGISSQLDAVAMCMPEEPRRRAATWTWRGAWRGTA